MKLSQDHESVLNMEGLYFKNVEFNRNDEKPDYSDMVINFRHAESIIDENKRDIVLEVKLGYPEKPDVFNLFVSLVGRFGLTSDFPEELRDMLFKKNAVAIMFPYMRSQLTLLTSQPGMDPFVLPPLNIAKLLESEKESEQEE